MRTIDIKLGIARTRMIELEEADDVTHQAMYCHQMLHCMEDIARAGQQAHGKLRIAVQGFDLFAKRPTPTED